MEPMLIREIHDAAGDVIRRYSPRAVQRVFSAKTTELLRTMLAAVVDSGTATAARVRGVPIGGKTGTAQKYDAAVGTYGRGKYLSSFVGFAPASDPTMVGVVVIDEPRSGRYYGGDVAAPVFREILLDVQRLARDELRGSTVVVASRPPSPAPVVVPDVRLLLPTAARARLAAAGLRMHAEGEGPRVLAQDPPAGVAAARGEPVTVVLSALVDSGRAVMPAVAGLTVRDALRRLAALSVRARVEGSGVVVRQEPSPGTPLPIRGVCRIYCEPGLADVAAARPGSS
jgi:stage V sporulation protein D (sporulation-specific penicillin-binding protein)